MHGSRFKSCRNLKRENVIWISKSTKALCVLEAQNNEKNTHWIMILIELIGQVSLSVWHESSIYFSSLKRSIFPQQREGTSADEPAQQRSWKKGKNRLDRFTQTVQLTKNNLNQLKRSISTLNFKHSDWFKTIRWLFEANQIALMF